jgi:lipopolysaccharide transport system ATP-binding protein
MNGAARDAVADAGTGGELMLELTAVSHSYHGRRDNFEHGVHRVLDEVSLQLYRGETLGIIGRNGAGKTTLLRLMAGILAPSKGRVWRRPGSSCSLLTLGLGFQPDLSGRDNALLSAMLQGASRREAAGYLEDIREFSELGVSFDEPVKTYSAGMRARLGFTTALLTHVDILLIDEVLGVGDAAFRQKAAAAMRDKLGGEQTVVLVSHMAAQVRRLCTRAVLLEDARVVADGAVDDVLERYEPAGAGAPPGSGPPRQGRT